MMRSKGSNSIIILAVIAFAIGWVFVAILNPLWARHNVLERRIVEHRRTIERLRRDVERQKMIAQSQLARQLSPLWTNPSSAEHASYVARTIARLCKQSNMKLESVQPTTPRDGKVCEFHPTTVTATGDLSGVTELLLEINALRGALDVERLSLRGNDSSGKLTVEMTLTSFSRKRKTEKQATEQGSTRLRPAARRAI